MLNERRPSSQADSVQCTSASLCDVQYRLHSPYRRPVIRQVDFTTPMNNNGKTIEQLDDGTVFRATPTKIRDNSERIARQP